MDDSKQSRYDSKRLIQVATIANEISRASGLLLRVMATIQKRLTVLESKQANADLAGMTDAELDACLGALQAGSPQWFKALMAGIWRKGSRLPLKNLTAQ